MARDTSGYWLTEEFCREHGQKGATVLAREFHDGKLSAWYDRRGAMRARFPALVPILNRQGQPLGATAPKMGHRRYAESSETMADGSQRSDRLIDMSAEQSKDHHYLLDAHGFDATEWEIVTARSSMWQQSSTEDGATTLYASRVTVKPFVRVLTAADVASALCDVVPVHIEPPTGGDLLLELGFVDAHFGNSTLEWYRDPLARILALIRSQTWKRIIVPVGSDFYHVDNFKNTTSNLTPQSSVDWPAAVADGTEFICTIIEAALECGEEVFVYYQPGNHDESMTWMFCQGLAWKYPQVHLDLDISERKVHRWNDIAIGMTHGDSRNRKDLDRVFMSEFPEFASATVREVHAAHYHHEVSVDQFGVNTRSLSTAARTDKWHREEGFVGAMKRWMCFEYEPDALRAIHYV